MPAQDVEENASGRYLAKIQLNTADELRSFLQRSEQLFVDNNYQASELSIALVLHGPEAKIFLQDNYLQNKSLVDMAARLSAFGVVKVNVCEMWMGGEGIDGKSLPPFVDTVPFGPAEKKRLIEKEGYVYF